MTDTRLAGLEAQLEAARQYGKQLQELGLAAKDLNAGEKESLKISAEMEKATDAKTLAKLKNAKATADELGGRPLMMRCKPQESALPAVASTFSQCALCQA